MTTTAPSAPAGTRPQPVTPLVTAEQITAATPAQLMETIALLLDEQRYRALRDADPDAVGQHGFESGFDRSGKPQEPYLYEGLLVCPGGKTTKSKTSHDCVFVALGDTWVWESEDGLFDDMRQVPGGKWMQTVTVVPATEGMELDMVESRSRSGSRCQMVSARSFSVQEGRLVETQVRTRSLSGHR